MEPIQEKRELLIEEDERQLHLLQEKIRLKKEMKENYTIISYIELESEGVESENKYNLSFDETLVDAETLVDTETLVDPETKTTEPESDNYIRFKLLDNYTRDPVMIDIKCKMIREYKELCVTVSYEHFKVTMLEDGSMLRDNLVTPVITIRSLTSQSLTSQTLTSPILVFPEDYVRLFLPTCLSIHQDYSCIYDKVLLIQCEQFTEKTEIWKYKNTNKILPEIHTKIIENSLYFVSNITSFCRYAIIEGWLTKSIKTHFLKIDRS